MRTLEKIVEQARVFGHAWSVETIEEIIREAYEAGRAALPPEAAPAPVVDGRWRKGNGSGEYDHAIHSSPRATDWAEFFGECFPPGSRVPDEGTMLGWFANAMMAMHDSRLAPASPPKGTPLCPECGGSGYCENYPRGGRTCPECAGSGGSYEGLYQGCEVCGGTGRGTVPGGER